MTYPGSESSKTIPLTASLGGADVAIPPRPPGLLAAARQRFEGASGLHKAALLGAARTGIQMAASFLNVKIISVYLGPAGIGVLGQLQGFMGVTLGVVSHGVNTGIIRRTAEYGDDIERRRLLLSTVVRALFVVGLAMSMAVLASAPRVARQLLGNADYAPAVMVFGAVYLCGLFGSMLMGMANGMKDYPSTTLIDIGNTLSTVTLYALFAALYGVAGGLVAAALAPLALMAVGTLVVRRKPWFSLRQFTAGFSRAELWRVAVFLPMAAAVAVGEPLAQIIVRNALAARDGMHAVGLVQGVWRISDLYLSIFIGMFSMYFLPRFVEIRTACELRREVARALMYVVPAVAVLSAVLYLLRDLIIALVFTHEFVAMRDLFGWQMIGNVFSIVGWIFGYVLVARISPLWIAVIELAKGAAWILFGLWLVPAAGALGAVQSHVATYAVYMLVTGICVFAITRGPSRNGTMTKT